MDGRLTVCSHRICSPNNPSAGAISRSLLKNGHIMERMDMSDVHSNMSEHSVVNKYYSRSHVGPNETYYTVDI